MNTACRPEPLSFPLVRAENVRKTYRVRAGMFSRTKHSLHAVKDVTLSIYPGETLGLVGESGCGKSTLGRLLVYLEAPSKGRIRFRDTDLSRLSPRDLRKMRRHFQIVFQDPYSSLNPRKTIGWLIGEPLVIHGIRSTSEVRDRVALLMEEVGLRPSHMNRFPHEFSGGQRQRVGIARALALNPDFIVADEPTSALDVSIQAQILQLLQRLQEKHRLTYLVISHDLAVIHHISDRIGVMYLGRLVELAPRERFLSPPFHPYTEALLSAAPRIGPQYRRRKRTPPLAGDVPSLLNPPPGCPFHPRCPLAQPLCKETLPPLEHKGAGHYMACHFR